jgi:murein DD-endopeptidase MepM/ murein hydrolase activator NlpD
VGLGWLGRRRPALSLEAKGHWLRRLAGVQLVALAVATSTLGSKNGPEGVLATIVAPAPPAARASSASVPPVRFAWPIDGPITNYMNDGHPLGIDIGLAEDPDSPITATASGTVVFAGGRYCCSYGYYVVIDHGDGFSSLYGHLSSFTVSEGQQVRQGEVIGFGGDSGLSTSAHLHFEIRRGEDHLDPLRLLPQEVRDQSQALGD